MDRLISQIEKIKEINANNKLVIFMGAGVSKNSGVCSWWELVKEIADRINENKCKNCEMKTLVCGECGESIELCSFDNYKCKLKYNFSSDDFLIIPQHYFESLGDDKSEYYKLLKDKFCSPLESNPIDDIIVSLNPEHIITTNYDHLLEDTHNPNVSKYTLVKNDDEMLSKSGRNYIIKMHGDIDDLEKIVLKEDDYLKYSQNHILIENYIKALLIDKTFLFVGYSLNDNNLKLIMSYIDYFVKEKNIADRQPHYLAVSEIENSERNIPYWINKGVELIDLSQINNYMLVNSKCDSIVNPVGKQLYTLLNYIKNDELNYTVDKAIQLNLALAKAKDVFSCFKFISYKTLLKICDFKSIVDLKTPLLTFRDISEYEQFKFIAQDTEIQKLFNKSRIYGAQLNASFNREQYHFDQENQEQEFCDILFELSIQNKYTEIIKELENSPDTSEKAYYYSLIKYTYGLERIMNAIMETMNSINYLHLTNQQYYDLAIYEFNNTCFRNLTYSGGNSEYFERLNLLLNNAVAQYGEAYNTIKDITDKNADIQEMNSILLFHEEYYMKKSTMHKMGGTINGDLYRIQQVAYDYYLFYKKNHLMLDWFSNVEKIVEPYVKAILCTYYPDEYQFSPNSFFGRTRVEPYYIKLIDIDMIVKHVKLKNFQSWISYYKVFSVYIDSQIDIAELFENFCISMKTFWNVHLIEQLETFSLLLSLSEMSKEQNKRIVDAFINLSTPDKTTNIRALTNNIFAIWTFVERHYDKTIESYTRLLELLINDEIITQPTSSSNAYPDLVKKLSENSNEEIYQKCCKTIVENTDNRQKSFLAYVYHPILLKYHAIEWKAWILENIQYNWTEEIFTYLQNDIITFDENVRQYYIEKVNKSDIDGLVTYPDSKSDAITQLIILLLLKYIKKVEDIAFLEQYSSNNDYLAFLFHSDSFNYSKITTADIMWCNFMNVDKFREIIIPHKVEFWTKDDEKRISLGFGSPFENRITYKYLFD